MVILLWLQDLHGHAGMHHKGGELRPARLARTVHGDLGYLPGSADSSRGRHCDRLALWLAVLSILSS
jgi:hypothetical protein